MSKWAHFEDNKWHDYHWQLQKRDDMIVWNFSTGDIFIGQIFKMGKSNYSAVTCDFTVGFPVDGFRSRHCAGQFMLELRRMQKKERINASLV